MLGLVTTHDRDLSIFMRPLDGNSSDAANLPPPRKRFLTRSTSPPTVLPCAGFFNALKALISCTFVWDYENTCRFWAFNLSIRKFSVCLVLPTVNSIFSLRKLRNVGRKIFFLQLVF